MVDRSTIERFTSLLAGRGDVRGTLYEEAVKEIVTLSHRRFKLEGTVSLGIYPLVPAGVVRRQGHPCRPSVTDRRRFQGCYGATFEPLTLGDISHCQAARELGIGFVTLKRLLDTRRQEELI